MHFIFQTLKIVTFFFFFFESATVKVQTYTVKQCPFEAVTLKLSSSCNLL